MEALLPLDRRVDLRHTHIELMVIDRMDDPNDSRAYLLVPTPEGVRLLDQSQMARLRRFQAAFPHIAELFESLLAPHDAEDDKAR